MISSSVEDEGRFVGGNLTATRLLKPHIYQAQGITVTDPNRVGVPPLRDWDRTGTHLHTYTLIDLDGGQVAPIEDDQARNDTDGSYPKEDKGVP